MTRINAPCKLSKNIAFIDPGKAKRWSLNAAVKTCEQCPVLQQCALNALHAGGSVDGSMTRPATDVLQAGVICRGDARTARALAKIAGVDTPPKYRNEKRRNFAPDHCVNCRTPMVGWTRHPEEIPKGHVMAYARGHCVNCRTAYKKLLDAERGAPKLRKPARRRKIYTHCSECKRPVKMRGDELEPGYLRHFALGYCESCYKQRRHAREGARPGAVVHRRS